jgi:hypothetical protein
MWTIDQDLDVGEHELARARGRAGLLAAAAGLGLIPWFWIVQTVADLETPPPNAGESEFVDFYGDNLSTITLSATLFVVQWVIVLVLVLGVVRAACRRLDLAAHLAVTLAGAATAVYVAAEGVLVWPVLAFGMTSDTLRENLDPGIAQATLLSRDGLHAPASVLLGISVLVIAWLLSRSELWGRCVMSILAAIAGAVALTSVMVGPEGLGPGLIFVVWGPVVAVLLLVGRWRLSTRLPREP